MQLSVRIPARDTSTTLVVDLDDAATVGDLRSALLRSQTGLDGNTPLWCGATVLEDDTPVRTSGIRDGVALGLGGPDSRTAVGLDGLQAHVVGGPDAGRVIPLDTDVAIGRGDPGAVTLDDPRLSRRHAVLLRRGDGAAVRDVGSRNGTSLDGLAVEGERTVGPGQQIRMGDSLLEVREVEPPDAALVPGEDGALTYSRPPRLLPPPQDLTIPLPEKPQEATRREFPVIAIVVPLAFGVLMASIVGNPMYLLFALLSPVMVVANTVQDRRRGGQDARRALVEYEAAMAEVGSRTAAALQAEQRLRRAEHPDPALTLLIAQGPRRRLWERRKDDEDFLALRVGVADLPARTRHTTRQRRDEEPLQPLTASFVPLAVSLRQVGVLGVAGPRSCSRGTVRAMLAQLAVLHSPRDASIVVLAPRQSEDEWSWLRWLPHARPSEGQDAVVAVGNDSETTAARVAELMSIVKGRTTALRESSGQADASAFSAVVVVLDGARLLRLLPGVASILKDGPRVGVYAVCLDDEERLLPEECSATITWDAEHPALVTLRRTLHAPITEVLADQVSAAWSEELARALSPIRDISLGDDDAGLPSAARLLDLLDLDPPTPEGVRSMWTLGGRTTRAVIGAGIDGAFALDLRRDGPHGLIAGTTGSGKSELLQTIVASLAVANRPDAMTFVLVDYKGGSAFKDCVDLPHTVGMVTDLDSHLVERALTSLSAELKHREHLLARAGAKDIEDYEPFVDRGEFPPMPRLLIVIDEFASMARELPDFVSGLVNVAQRGRSLGIHLLLATQRPSGVVSPEIRANTNLRIALRVTDASESSDVLDASDAARISKSTPGRGYVRLAASTLLPFQAGRVGGKRPGTRASAVIPPFIVPIQWEALGLSAPTRPRREETLQEETDLSALVAAVVQANAQLGIAEQRRPWLPPLPDSVLLSDLAAGPTEGPDLPGLVYGVEDLPAEQVQRPAVLPLSGGGHLLAIGTSRSGRSQLLRTLAGSAAISCSPRDLHLYGIDCGNGALLPLTALPHCGAVVTRTEPERATRLLGRLKGELERRQALLSAGRFADVDEQRRAAGTDERLPHLLLMVDRWEGFTTTLGELDGGRLQDLIMSLLREGPGAGIHLVITGDASLLSGRVSTTTDDKIGFRLADRGDYTMLGLSPRTLPAEVAAGRAFRSETGIEVQVALLARDPGGQAQASALASLARAVAEVPQSAAQRPLRVDVLPSTLDVAGARALVPDDTSAMFGLVGVGGDELIALGVDFASSPPAFVVAGPPKSGRSTLLAVMTDSLLRAGSLVVICAPRPSPLLKLADRPGVVAVFDGGDVPQEELARALDEAGDAPLVVVADDAEVLVECEARELMRRLVKGTAGGRRAIVLGGSADDLCSGFSNWQVDAKKSRQGALLSPQGLGDGDLIGVRVPRSSIGSPVVPGRALLHLGDGALVSVQVPLP